MAGTTDSVRVRAATVADLPDVSNVIDGAALELGHARLRSAIDRGDVLVATAARDDDRSERVLGTLVLDGTRVAAIAVRRRRRDQGIGTTLVAAARERQDRLVVEFRPSVRPFWDALGVDVVANAEDGRLRGVLS